MPIGNVSKDSAPKRDNYRPPWVKDKDTEAPPPWTQRKLKPVESSKATGEADDQPTPTVKSKPGLKKQATVKEKSENGVAEPAEEKLVKPSAAKQADKVAKPADEKPRFTKSALKSVDKSPKSDDKVTNNKPTEKPALRTVRTIDDKAKEKSVTIVDKKGSEKAGSQKIEEKSEKPTKNGPSKLNNTTTINDKNTNDKSTTNSIKDNKSATKANEPKVEEKIESKSKMATKPPTPLEKTPSKLPPRKPSLQKQPSKDEPVKKWRDPLHERVKDNIDKTLANEIPKGHTLTKNESLRSLLKPTPPPMPPPMPPKMPPPPEFKKAPIDPTRLKKLEQLRSRPRKRPDWSDMMKEVEQGKKLKHVVCNDRSSPIITKTAVVKNKDQFIFESEKPNSHNELLKEISKGIKLKKVKCNDRSKPNLEGLRKFRRQMTIEEQVQKSMSQANIQASPSGASVAEVPGVTAEEEEIDEMDDIDKVRDDLQSTKQLLAIELRNKEAQERENKRLLTRIQNLEAELARERAIIRQEQHKTVISVTDAYDERLVNSLKMEVEKTKENADSLEKKYLDAAEERDTALTELEELKRRNAELEKKLEQALSGIMPTNAGSRRSSHAIKQLSVTKDDSFEEEEESEEEEEESEEKKQKRMEKEVRNMRNKIRHLKEKQDHMKKERMGFKMALKNQQAALKDEKKKYKELKREVDKMASMLKEVGSDEEEDEEEEEESEEEKKSETEEEETETETEQDTESETESESEPEDAPLPKKKDNLTKRVKRHETRVNALKKGNALLMANVDRLKDDVLKQREESVTLQKELDSLIEDLE
ncbi:golgin subfamily A member 6-like protein 25 isoform X3 [Galleria mellonella]|uniref:Golgin subfamily A member 6-like protein 25 isoform X3 n=1 Tax=Galleria mellonella TaxID=7137 RepID=A0A6J1WRM5_GALME|nr:golgin subfamily A member 6-like protein 25 isoform X3 [Galleria mellonella]